jgi:hypothetical protein
MAKKIVEPLGDLTSQLEEVLHKMVTQHDMQTGQIFAQVERYMDIHWPSCVEPYNDGTQPFRYYGHIDGLIAYAEGLKNVRNKSNKSNKSNK